MTLYGHMYDIFVEEGEPVSRGDIIGLSGGAPGTRGAGYLTTGAHLHFETLKDGVNVDPMPYLDPEEL
jgi:murein DD-endopeptidase MepM/ murein hydrolase activator NlpD